MTMLARAWYYKTAEPTMINTTLKNKRGEHLIELEKK